MTNRRASCFGRALCRTKHSGAAERVASLNVDCVGTRRLARGGSRTLAVIVQSKVRAVTDGGPNRFTVADAPEIVRRSMARANHVGLPLKRSYAVNPNTVHERNWRRRFPAACFPGASPKALWKRASSATSSFSRQSLVRNSLNPKIHLSTNGSQRLARGCSSRFAKIK
jgi:hypothetical protein